MYTTGRALSRSFRHISSGRPIAACCSNSKHSSPVLVQSLKVRVEKSIRCPYVTVSIDPAEHEEYSRQQRKQQMKHERRQEYESNTPQNKVYSKTKYTKQEKKAYIGASNKNNTPQLSATAITLDLEEYAKGNANAQENIANVLGALKKDKVAVTSRNETLELANQALNAARKAKLANLVIYNSYIDILFKTKQKAKVVMDTLSIMFEDELTPNISTFNTIINNCVEMDNLRYMERVIVVMDENNVQPDTITFNSMLKLAVKYNYDEYLAFALYKVFIKDYGVKPDRYTLSLLLDIQLHNGDVQGAHDTVDLWISLRREVTPLVYMQFLEAERDACKETRDPESVKRALATLTLMEQRGVPWTQKEFTIIFQTCAHAHDFTAAQAAYSQMQQKGIAPDAQAVSALLSAACVAEDVAAGEFVHGIMKENNIKANLVLYTQLIRLYTDDYPKVVQTLHEMSAKGIEPSARTYHATLVPLYKKPECADFILSIYDQIRERGVVLHPLDYARIIETTAPSYPKDALLIYEEVLHHFNREYRPNRECLRVLFSKCENAEDRNRVKNLLFYGRDVRKGIDLNSVEPILKCQSCHINHKTMNVRECNICTCVLCLKCTENHMYIREEPRSHTNGHEHHIQTFYCPNCVT